ncbi:phosphopantetheine-binding protein [Paraglaciecola aquimarina]|uniref:Phosphopantetheine-binding protein n=1 Tax=Paraglaciecola aquimarina TaxID=1235557 RepID=A0ABU3SSN7_9ALTE|nr:phosphopantetheine-binding protein [Paraglaciecola aquimarina]MDU0353024.1 phosphopantetheine-binding protein [Paraglaciecola aquimarina]
MSALILEIKTLIIDALDLEDVTPEDIEDEAPLFVDGLGLDSIDALELGVAIKKAYNVKIDGNTDESKKYFYSVKSLHDFVLAARAAG